MIRVYKELSFPENLALRFEELKYGVHLYEADSLNDYRSNIESLQNNKGFTLTEIKGLIKLQKLYSKRM